MSPNLVFNWLNESVIGIEIWQFVGLGVMALIIVVARFAIIFALNQAIRRRTAPERHEFWQFELKRMQRPLLLLLGAVTLAIGFPVLDFDPDVENVVEIFANFASTFAGVLVGFRLVDAAADYRREMAAETDSKLDDQLVPLARTAGKIFVGAIGAVFILQNLDVNITSLIAGLGLGGLAVALAAQDTLKNLLGGATILADKPFQVGDWVILDDIEGTVEQVGFRSTRIRTFADSLITVPNARMTDTAVNNMGQRTWRRYYTTVGIAYHTDPDRIQAFVEGIRATVRSNPNMRHDYYIVELHSFGDSALNIMVYTFIG
ncbi:MAG: mechanosensitive ion channel, partial [Chloroflexi bacterium]|nr:mechanosensitive ion channel [Chloroflexota bacterium]